MKLIKSLAIAMFLSSASIHTLQAENQLPDTTIELHDKVNVNTADAEQLSDALKGIGLKKAQAIVDYREKNGDFTTLQDIENVKGIGASTIEKNSGVINLK